MVPAKPRPAKLWDPVGLANCEIEVKRTRTRRRGRAKETAATRREKISVVRHVRRFDSRFHCTLRLNPPRRSSSHVCKCTHACDYTAASITHRATDRWLKLGVHLRVKTSGAFLASGCCAERVIKISIIVLKWTQVKYRSRRTAIRDLSFEFLGNFGILKVKLDFSEQSYRCFRDYFWVEATLRVMTILAVFLHGHVQCSVH